MLLSYFLLINNTNIKINLGGFYWVFSSVLSDEVSLFVCSISSLCSAAMLEDSAVFFLINLKNEEK